jgi:hypothetical protein
MAFTEHEINLTFKDPRQNGEIEKILLDPQYRPGNASNADFWVATTITSPVSNRKVSETALCYWKLRRIACTDFGIYTVEKVE